MSPILWNNWKKSFSKCTEVNQTYRNKIRTFMAERRNLHISELDYSLREEFHNFLTEQISPVSFRLYERAFDQIKQY